MMRLEALLRQIGRSAPRYACARATAPGSLRTFHQTEGTVQLPLYSFNCAAYGIPKKRRKQAAQPSPSARHGLLDHIKELFFPRPPPPPPPLDDDDDLPAAISALHGSGLRSSIRDEGRIVHTRLLSQQVGEDAYFLMDDAIGVADGVGGWAMRPGGDPALFSRLLMHFCRAELDMVDARWRNTDNYDNEWQGCDPVEIMQSAWERCVRASKREGIMGSSTALLALLRGDELRIANIGDCVLIIIRDGDLVFRTIEQQHSFNFPLQLGMMGATPESVRLAAAISKHRDGVLRDGGLDRELPYLGHEIGDLFTHGTPDESGRNWDSPREDAGAWVLRVQEGDIVVLSSDGMLDNLFDEDILDGILEVCKDQPEDASHYEVAHAISETLCLRAKAASEDPRLVVSPFQQQASGKVDDITVVTGIVARVDEEHYEPDDSAQVERVTAADAREIT